MASYTPTNWVNGQTSANATNMNKIEQAIKVLYDMVYPVGSIYMSVNSANPSTLFGGTWEAWGKGRVPVGIDTNGNIFNSVEETGGEKTHTLTIQEMPSHSHNGSTNFIDNAQMGGSQNNRYAVCNGGGSSLNDVTLTSSTGGGQPHNIVQPYIVCYMWKRVQ